MDSGSTPDISTIFKNCHQFVWGLFCQIAIEFPPAPGIDRSWFSAGKNAGKNHRADTLPTRCAGRSLCFVVLLVFYVVVCHVHYMILTSKRCGCARFWRFSASFSVVFNSDNTDAHHCFFNRLQCAVNLII